MTARPEPEWDADDLDPQPARPIIGPDDVDLLIEALGHYAGSLTDRAGAVNSQADLFTVDRLARLQRTLTVNRDTLAQLFAGVAPALDMTEE